MTKVSGNDSTFYKVTASCVDTDWYDLSWRKRVKIERKESLNVRVSKAELNSPAYL
ncbi:hypothetical protein [Shewanella woodyi]|uniref:hypothetical protein n=1 Tax=Shewanella woodyi TaxID=60961 RepID=UPI0012FB589A|nr:hypothetical protein [Shewanella woodyi]